MAAEDIAMPEEKEQSPNEGQKPSSLDQETLDQMLAESQGDADHLESLLNNLEDNAETETAPITEGGDTDLSELTDDMEAMLERMESDEPDESATSDASGDDADVSDLNDMLYQATLADTEQSQPGGDADVLDLDDAVASLEEEDDDDPVDALLAEADEIDDGADEALDSLINEADDAEDDGGLEALLEDVEDEVPEDVTALEDDDLDAMLQESETEDESDGLDAMLEEIEEEALEEEPKDAEEDLEALLEDVEEEPKDAEEDLEALLEDVEEDSEDDDLEALLGDAEEEAKDDNLEALLDDFEEESEGDEDDLDAMLEDIKDESEGEDLEDEDLEALLDDSEEESEEDDLESLDDSDLDAMLEDLEEESEDEDLEALLDDSEEEPEEDDLESLDDSDLDAMLEDIEDESEDEDLKALLDDSEEEPEEDDLESLDDSDLDAMLEDLEEESEVEAFAEDDLDTLLGDDDGLDDDLDDLLDDFETEDEPLYVGIEDEVAQILATGESLNGDDSILDDFKSVQESIITSPSLSGDVDGTLLMIDGDPDQRTLFEDALGGQYGFAEADTLEEALRTLHNEHVDLILLSLDDNEGEALEFIEQVNASLDMPSIPIIVTSEHTDRIESALRLGAVDYITCPLDIMDIEFQVPQKVANQMKLQKAERILAGASEASGMGSGGLGVADFDLEDESDLDLDDLLEDEDAFLFDEDASPEDLLVRPSSKKDPLVPLSDQQKILRNRKTTRRDMSRIPLFALILAFLAASVGGVYQYADEIKDLLSLDEKAVTKAPPRPKQPLPKVKMPTVPKQNYASSAMPTPPPAGDNIYQQQADVLKGRIRESVRALADNGGAWWSPWRVMRSSGASVSGLVDRQSVQGILEAFDVDVEAVNRGLQSQRTLDYLAGVGYDLRGKDASDLSAREAFELLSARQIKNANQIVEVLSKLTDGLAADRTAQEEHKEQERRRRKGQALLNAPQDDLLVDAQAVVVTPRVFALQSDRVIHSKDGDGRFLRVGWPIIHRV
ncbi:MAG: CheY-like chemotaxis protein [Candidatus Latescibacterota bacterium]